MQPSSAQTRRRINSGCLVQVNSQQASCVHCRAVHHKWGWSAAAILKSYIMPSCCSGPSARGLAARLLSFSPSCGELDASASPTAYPNIMPPAKSCTHGGRPSLHLAWTVPTVLHKTTRQHSNMLRQQPRTCQNGNTPHLSDNTIPVSIALDETYFHAFAIIAQSVLCTPSPLGHIRPLPFSAYATACTHSKRCP